jgi:hypothetical protein
MNLQTEQNNLLIQQHFLSISSCAKGISAWLMLCEEEGITANSLNGIIDSAEALSKIAKRILPFVDNAEAMKLKLPLTLEVKTDQSDILDSSQIDFELLIQRIKQGGHSGLFLADAYLSTYRGSPFPHALKEIMKLDIPGFRLFMCILHMRQVPGWDDDALYEIEQKIIEILRG